MSRLLEKYYGKRVLVTGHTGFKGSWLCQILQLAGAEVFGYSLAPEQPENLYQILGLSGRMQECLGDIRDRETLGRFLQEIRPEIVFHLAAQPIVHRGLQDPVGTYETNVLGCVYLLEEVRRLDCVRTVIHITTDKVYENREWPWSYRESDPLGGKDPYSSSKACAELVTSAYTRSFLEEKGISVVTVRAGNVIGGGDFAENRLIPDCFRAARAGEAIVLRNPASTRPYQHVLEALHAYLLLGSRTEIPPGIQSYNVGPQEQAGIRTDRAAELFCRFWGEGLRWEVHPHALGAKESGRLSLDSAKLQIEQGWRPRLLFQESMKQTVDWYRRYARGEEVRTYTDQQISDFFTHVSEETQIPGIRG